MGASVISRLFAHGHQAHGGNIKITLQVLLARFPAVLSRHRTGGKHSTGHIRDKSRTRQTRRPGRCFGHAWAPMARIMVSPPILPPCFMKHTGDGAAGRDPFLALYGAAPARPCCLSVSDFLHHCSLLHAKRRLLRPLQMRTERAEQTSLFAIFRIIRKEAVPVKGETVLSMY